MNNQTIFLISLGSLLLAGLTISLVGRKTIFPRVTLLICFGMLVGPEGINLIPSLITEQFETIAHIALLMVGFLIGGKLIKSELIASSKAIISISLGASILTACIVTLGLYLLGVTIEIAIILGCIAAATDATAVFDVISQSKASSKFKSLLLSVVALDDAWALILFGLGVSIVLALVGNAETYTLVHAIKDIGGGILLGILLGFPAAYITGRLKPGKPVLSEALGIVFLCGGLALHFNVSFLISTMVLGAIIANFAKHHEYPFHAIEGIEEQFMLIFFILAGASLELDAAATFGFIGVSYIILRIVGKCVGASIGAKFSHVSPDIQCWTGPALLPQAGVAIGMGLVAANLLPELGNLLLATVICSTIFFEIIGPILTLIAIKKVNQEN